MRFMEFSYNIRSLFISDVIVFPSKNLDMTATRGSGDPGSEDDSLSRVLRSGTFWDRLQEEQECSLREVAGKTTEMSQLESSMM